MLCRRCGGRKQRPDESVACFLCHGKGNLEISESEMKGYFAKFRKNPQLVEKESPTTDHDGVNQTTEKDSGAKIL